MSIIILVLLHVLTPTYIASDTHFSVAQLTTQGSTEAKDLDRQSQRKKTSVPTRNSDQNCFSPDRRDYVPKSVLHGMCGALGLDLHQIRDRHGSFFVQLLRDCGGHE